MRALPSFRGAPSGPLLGWTNTHTHTHTPKIYPRKKSMQGHTVRHTHTQTHTDMRRHILLQSGGPHQDSFPLSGGGDALVTTDASAGSPVNTGACRRGGIISTGLLSDH